MAENDLQTWIGGTDTYDDNVDVGHIEKMAITLETGALQVGDALPLLWHWGLFIRPYPYDELGVDGHPARGGFLPPADDRNRMWAGGRLEFLHPLRVGAAAQRRSTIVGINEKQGRTGKLLFVTVQHEYLQDYVLCIREEQDIVYREPAAPKLDGSLPAPEAQWSETVVPSSTMLFRYSALTFNGHRIHYDQDYAVKEEGYPGLVVHGPLIATLMCRAFSRSHHDKVVTHLSYRGLRPLIAPKPFQVGGRLLPSDEHPESEANEGKAQLWAEQDGMLAHQAEIRFRT